jgi:hypothetical protein
VNPFAGEQRLLHTRLNPDECRARLQERIASWFSLTPSRQRPVEGRVSAHGFEIRKFVLYGNPYQTVAKGIFMPSPEGTRLVVRLGLSRWIRIFVGLWFGGIVFFTILAILLTMTQSPSLEAMLTRLAMPLLSLLLLFLFGAGTVWLGRWLARNEAEFLMRFLRETLEAEDHPGKQHRSQ